jgi:hypothetical protein
MIAAYQFTPSGVTFDPDAELIIEYDPEKLPEGSLAVISFFDEVASQWVNLETAGFVAAGVEVPNTVVSKVAHFTYFAVLAKTDSSAPSAKSRSNGEIPEYSSGLPITQSADARPESMQ